MSMKSALWFLDGLDHRFWQFRLRTKERWHRWLRGVGERLQRSGR